MARIDKGINDRELEDIYLDGWQSAEKTVTFDGGSGSGAVGTVNLFTVTGTVSAKVIAVCSTDLAGATATLSVGVTGATAGIIAVSTATDIDTDELWHDATPDSGIEISSVVAENIIVNGLDIFGTVATAAISAGVIKFICLWKGLSIDGNVDAV